MKESKRVQSIDVARGLVTVFMVLWHTAHGYLSAGAREGLLFDAISFVALLPLAGFLYLAGASLALRSPSEDLQKKMVFRGLRLLAGAYLLSGIYALITPTSDFSELLRSDVLHVIGLSIVVVALGVRSKRSLMIWAGVIAVGCLAFGFLIQRLDAPSSQLRFVVGLFIDVPKITYFPLVPLVALAALGVFAPRLLRLSTQRLMFSLALCIVVAVGSNIGMHSLHQSLGGVLDRQHPAISLNVIDLTARITVLLLLCEVASRMSDWHFPLLCFWGRHSLFIYAVHLPLCFGTLAHATEHVRIISMEELPMAFAAVLMISSGLAFLWQLLSANLKQKLR